MGKKKIVLDTNILVSALAYEGNEREIIRKCVKGDFSLFFTNATFKELERVSEYPKFNFTQNQKDTLKLIISEIGELIPAEFRVNLVSRDPSDNMFLEAVISAGADYLVTGDKHLLEVKKLGNSEIIRASELLNR